MFFSNNYITRNEVQDMIANLINENTTLKEKIQKLEDNIIQQHNIINEQSTQIKNNTVEINNQIKFNNKLQNMYDPIIQSIRDKQTELDQKIININCQNNDNINNTCKKVQQQIYDITETLNINNYSQIQSLDEVHKYIQQQIYNITDKINNIEKNVNDNIYSQLNTLKDKFDKTNIEHFTVVAIDESGSPILKDNLYMDGSYLNKDIHNITHLLPLFLNENRGKGFQTKKICLSKFKNMKIFELGRFMYSEFDFYIKFSDNSFSINFIDDGNNLNDRLVFKTSDPYRDYKFSKSSLRKLLNFCDEHNIVLTYAGKEEYNGKPIRDLILL